MILLIYSLGFCALVTAGLLYLEKKAIDEAEGDD